MNLDEETQEEVRKCASTLADYFSVRTTPTGLYKTIGKIDEKLGELNKNIKDANESSTKLTAALNKITLCGVIVAGSGILVALASFVLDLIKHMQGK